jgi:hypothetical protein
VRILLDECVHANIAMALPGHEVSTVTQSGWRSSQDGPLLRHAEKAFDVFVTVDRNLIHQQNISRYRLGFVILHVRTNQLLSYTPLIESLREAVQTVKPGQVIHLR